MDKVSVIIPSLNEKKSIRACLDALKAQTHKNVEIIVVDSGSEDGTAEVAKEYGRVISMDKLGPGAARNLGAKEASGGVVAFTDVDTIVPEDWVEQIAKHFEDPELIALGGIMEPLEGGTKDSIAYALMYPTTYRLLSLLGLFQSPGPNCAFRRDAFLSVGGFDESVSFLEDVMLSYKIAKKGQTKMDLGLKVRASARRFEQVGYGTTMIQYMKAYMRYFFNRPITEEYFEIIDH